MIDLVCNQEKATTIIMKQQSSIGTAIALTSHTELNNLQIYLR